MLIDTRTMGFSLSEAILRHVEHRAAQALGWARDHVGRVTVRLGDENAGRGGIDKRCRIVVPLRGRKAAVAEVVSNDLYAAIDEATARVRRAVSRRLGRHLTRQRKLLGRAGALKSAGAP